MNTFNTTDIICFASGKVAEGQGEDTEHQGGSEAAKSEEGMLQLIKGFNTDGLKSFMETQIHLPPSIHSKFSGFRQALGTRYKQFVDLPDPKLQLRFFYDMLQEFEVFPSAWLNYASSASFFLIQHSRFVEGTKGVFGSEARLARVLSMRAKYTILGLKDLAGMRALSASTDECQKVIVTNLACLSTQVEMIGDDDGGPQFPQAHADLLSALSAFDSDAWFQYGPVPEL